MEAMNKLEDTKSYTRKSSAAGFQVSVVIPTFNRVKWLGRAIQSVLDQTFPVLEIIVIDDGSIDGTRDMGLDNFGERVKYHYQENHGVSHARNTGIQKASGNWIAFLDSDDIWLPEKLQLQIAALEKNPEYRFCHTNEIWIRNGRRVNPMNKHDKSGGDIYRKCLALCVISPSSALVRGDVFDELGQFDESLPACEDYDFWLRYCSRYPVLYVESPQLIKNGGHKDQLSRRYWGMDRFRVQALLKTLNSGHLSEQDRVATIRMILEKSQVLQTGAKKHNNPAVLDFCQRVEAQINSVVKIASK